MIGYFENFYSPYGELPDVQGAGEAGVFRPACLRGGIGADYLLGSGAHGAVRIVDLSRLREPVTFEFNRTRAGIITDGIDTIVFQGIEEIILPPSHFAAMRSSLRACSDHGVRLRAAGGRTAPGTLSAAQ
jgi:hypothetical protein